MKERIEHFEKIKPFLDEREVVIKVPMDYEGFKTLLYLRNNYPEVKVLGTVVYTATQGIIACQLGCEYIAPYYNRMLQQGTNSNEVLSEIREYIELHNLDTKIIAASFRTAAQVKDALLNGAHTATVPLNIFKEFIACKATDQDVKVFCE